MIIGISGKIGSGKDTVGKIIQYLTSDYYPNKTFQRFLEKENSDFGPPITDWQIKKFAEYPKNIVCLLTGCNRDDLENQDFKNQELGEEWWYYKCKTGMSWCAITDKKTKIPVKYLRDCEIASYLEYKDCDLSDSIELVKPTYRTLLQRLGTEAGRDTIHPDIWVNSLMKDYKEVIYQYVDDEWNQGYSVFPNWIITDVRFKNELFSVRGKGFVIRVNRKVKDSKHVSETELDDAEFDYVIDNNGTIEELIQKVKEILIKEKCLR